MNILEEFWYGNIEPAEYDTSSSKEYKELLQLISRNEDKLLATMTEDQKEDMIKSSCGIGSEKNVFDWYNKNHFDYRGLIEKGLAVDCTNLNIY